MAFARKQISPHSKLRVRLHLLALLAASICTFVVLVAQRHLLLTQQLSPPSKFGKQSFDVAYTVEDQTWDDYENQDFAPAYADIWNPLAQNPTPLIEITAKVCYTPITLLDVCEPDADFREMHERGPWIRLNKDINVKAGLYYMYIFYRRLPPAVVDIPTIRNITVLTESEETRSPIPALPNWHKVKQNIRAGIFPSQEPAYLYYYTQERNHDANDEINELDVIWGNAATWTGWQRTGTKLSIAKGGRDESAELIYRKGNTAAPKGKAPRFHSDGTLKIMQIADLHFSVGKGDCRDTESEPCKVEGADEHTLNWLHSVIDEEKPDLIILSGDQVNGQGTTWSATSVLLKVAKLFENREIPWAAVFGNHDSEDKDLTRYGQMIMMQELPYFIGEPGPVDVAGEGNYVIPLHSADDSYTQLFTLYFLDSHANAQSFNPFVSTYDWIKQSQIDWFVEQSNNVKPIMRPFSPPTLDNSTFGLIDDILRRQDAIQSLKKPNAMAIFHIPLLESYDKPDVDTYGKEMVTGSRLDVGKGSPEHNSGFFAHGILKQKEIEDDGTLSAADRQAVLDSAPEVKLILNGHCHITDDCRRHSGVWMCFAGGASFSGYSQVGFDKRVRVIQLSDYGERISTYKIADQERSSKGSDKHEKLDDQVLIGV